MTNTVVASDYKKHKRQARSGTWETLLAGEGCPNCGKSQAGSEEISSATWNRPGKIGKPRFLPGFSMLTFLNNGRASPHDLPKISLDNGKIVGRIERRAPVFLASVRRGSRVRKQSPASKVHRGARPVLAFRCGGLGGEFPRMRETGSGGSVGPTSDPRPNTAA